MQVTDSVPIEQGMVDLERVLRREHKIRPGGDNDFTIRNQQDVLATQQQTTQVFTSLLASIAAVSLARGRHRHHEHHAGLGDRADPGDRRAQGARRHPGNIMLQFLIEALALCLVGGALGVLLGVGAAITLSRVMQWNTLISPAAVTIAFGFSAIVGLFFGLWPARRAARLDPDRRAAVRVR